MSISVRKVIDARVDGASSVNQHHDFATGASSATFQAFEATSKSSGTLEFNVLVPGQNAYWNRRVVLETQTVFKCDINYQTAIAAPTIRYGRDVGVCGFPMNTLLQTVTTSINGSTITTQANQIMPLVRRLVAANASSQKHYNCPSSVSSYADNAEAGASEANELLTIGRSVDRPSSNATHRVFTWGTVDASGNFSKLTTGDPDSLVLPGATTPGTMNAAKFSSAFMITTREPLLVAPFITTDDEPAFTNVQAANVRCTIMQPSDASIRILRSNKALFETVENIQTAKGGCTLDDPGLLTGDAYVSPYVRISNVQFASSQPFQTSRLWCNFLSPSPDQLVPASTIYPYMQFDPLQNATATAMEGGTITLEAGSDKKSDLRSQTVILNTCPDMIAVYAILGDPTAPGATVPVIDDNTTLPTIAAFSGREDLFATIDNISIMWNNQPAILATASRQELWRMSYDNGLKVPFDVYNGVRGGGTYGIPAGGATGCVATTGAPLLLAINKDFPTEPGTAPGVAGVFSLQVSARAYFCSATGVKRTATLYVVPIKSQYLQLNAGGTSSVVGAISSGEAMLDAPFATTRLLQDATPEMAGGFGWNMGNLASAASSAKKLWSRGKDIVEQAKGLHDKYREHEGAIKGALGNMGSFGEKAKAGLEAVGLGGGLIGHGRLIGGIEGHGAGSGKRPRLETSAYARY